MLTAVVPKKRGRKPKNSKLSSFYLAFVLTPLFIAIIVENGEDKSEALTSPSMNKSEEGEESSPNPVD